MFEIEKFKVIAIFNNIKFNILEKINKEGKTTIG